MNHPATFVLPLSASRVLDVLHSMFAVGELIAISQDEIAQRGNISEASVSRAMPVLVEHGFLEREWKRTMNGGKGGYWLRLLPLPALEGSIADPLSDGSTTDPLPAGAAQPTPMPPIPDPAPYRRRDQLLIPSAPPMVHDSLSQEEESARAALFHRLLAAPTMDRALAQRIAKNPPGTLADFETDLRIAQAFAKTPFWFTVGKWKNQQRVIAPEVCHEREQSTGAGRRSAENAAGRLPGRNDHSGRYRGSHNPTGGAELHNPGWQQRELARIQQLYGIPDADL